MIGSRCNRVELGSPEARTCLRAFSLSLPCVRGQRRRNPRRCYRPQRPRIVGAGAPARRHRHIEKTQVHAELAAMLVPVVQHDIAHEFRPRQLEDHPIAGDEAPRFRHGGVIEPRQKLACRPHALVEFLEDLREVSPAAENEIRAPARGYSEQPARCHPARKRDERRADRRVMDFSCGFQVNRSSGSRTRNFRVTGACASNSASSDSAIELARSNVDTANLLVEQGSPMSNHEAVSAPLPHAGEPAHECRSIPS